MNILHRVIAILFCTVLLVCGVRKETAGSLIQSENPNPKAETISSNNSLEKAVALLLNRYGERLIASVKIIPVLGLNIHFYRFSQDNLASELRNLSIRLAYLSSSEKIFHTQKQCDIVFPFHYFW